MLLMIAYASQTWMCIGNQNVYFIFLWIGNPQITVLVWNIGSVVLTVWLITVGAYGVKQKLETMQMQARSYYRVFS